MKSWAQWLSEQPQMQDQHDYFVYRGQWMKACRVEIIEKGFDERAVHLIINVMKQHPELTLMEAIEACREMGGL